MAQKVSIELVDDLNGESADETVTFGLDGTTYEIDLSEKNVKSLRKALTPYVGAARKVTGRRVGSTTRARSTGPDTRLVRQWAQENGVEVNDRGRVPAAVVAQYEAANA